MVNTLQNSPEKIPSKGGNKFKKAIALAIALTLSGEPAEAKTYEKQEFSTEMVANMTGKYAPMTENVEQATVPNYINQAQNGVKKYYPQYEEYFRTIFTKINGISYNTKRIINGKIQENLEIFEEDIVDEKNKYEIILMVMEKLIGKNNFEKSNNFTNESKEISKEITIDINNQVKKEIKETRDETNNIKNETEKIEKRNNKLKEIINYLNKGKKDKETTSIIATKIEEYFNLCNINEVIEDKGLQKIIKEYIILNNQINRTPSNTGKIFINEYKRISR